MINAFHFQHYYQYLALLIENLLLIQNYLTAFQIAMVSTVITIMSTYHHYTINFVNRSLEKISLIFKKLSRFNNIHYKKSIIRYYCRILHRVKYLHGHVAQIYVFSYREIWSDVVFKFFISSLPLNVLCVISLNNDQLFLQFMLLILLIFFTHSLVLIILLMSMAAQTESLHRSKKYLPIIIPQISFDGHWRLKLQYDDWFNRLNRGKKYGPFMANIGSITYNKAFKVIKNKI